MSELKTIITELNVRRMDGREIGLTNLEHGVDSGHFEIRVI